MAVASMKNPEEILNFPLTPTTKLMHSIACLNNSEFNAQGVELVEVAEKDWDVTVRKTPTQVAESLFSKYSEFISFLFTQLVDSKMMINLVRISLTFDDAAANDTRTTLGLFFPNGSTNHSIFVMGAALIESCKGMFVSWIISQYTGNFLDYCLQNSKGLLPFHSGNGRSDSSFIRRTSSSMRASPVRNYAAAESRNGNVPYQNDVQHPLNANRSVPNNDNVIHGPNGNGDDGNDGTNGGSGDGGNDGGNGVHPMFYWHPPIALYRIAVNYDDAGTINRSPIMYTDIFASQYDSWEGIFGAIHQIWLRLSGNSNNIYNNDNVRQVYGPRNCWPDCTTYIGRYEGDIFRQYKYPVHRWEDVKEQVTVAIIFDHQISLFE